jgi:hypothetical protein
MLIREYVLLVVLCISPSLHGMENSQPLVEDDGILSPEEAIAFFIANDPEQTPPRKKIKKPTPKNEHNGPKQNSLNNTSFFTREERVVRHLKMAHLLARRDGITESLADYVQKNYQRAYSEHFKETTKAISLDEAMALIAVVQTKLILLSLGGRREIFTHESQEPKPKRKKTRPVRLIEST